MASTFTLHATYHKPDGTPQVQTRPVHIYVTGTKVVKDTAGNVIISGRVEADVVDGVLNVPNLPDPRDTTLNPTGFGYTVSAAFRDNHPAAVSFGGAALDAHLAGGVLELAAVTPVDPSTFTPTATYVESGTLATVATTGAYGDLSGQPVIPTTAADVGAEPAGAASTAETNAKTYADQKTAAEVTRADAAYVGATAIADAKTYGNDLTDAKAHFQSLADKLSTAGGGLLFIPRGTYRMSGPLLVPSHVTVRGEGATSVLKATFTGSGLIYNKNNATGGDTNITVTDLVVDGSGTANQGVAFAGVTRGTIHNVRVKNCTGYGIWLWSAGEGSGTPASQGTPTKHVTVSACHLTDIVDTGIEADAAQNCTVIGNTVEATGGRGFYAWNGATDCTFMGNVVEGIGASSNVWAYMVSGLDTRGIGNYPRQTARISFVGNSAYNVQTALKVTGGSGNAPSDITLNGNMAYTTLASSNGINLDYCTRVMLDGNHIEGFDNPIRISDPAQGGTAGSVLFPVIQNNRFKGGFTSQVYRLTNGQISGNQFHGQQNHVLAIRGCQGMTISGNQFADAGTTANANAMTFYDDGSAPVVPCSGNVVIGNHTIDTRATKYLGNVLTIAGAGDYNICTGNSARGARAGGQAVQNAGTGVNNVIANNLNA